jgi:hypothetical protein
VPCKLADGVVLNIVEEGAAAANGAGIGHRAAADLRRGVLEVDSSPVDERCAGGECAALHLQTGVALDGRGVAIGPANVMPVPSAFTWKPLSLSLRSRRLAGVISGTSAGASMGLTHGVKRYKTCAACIRFHCSIVIMPNVACSLDRAAHRRDNSVLSRSITGMFSNRARESPRIR